VDVQEFLKEEVVKMIQEGKEYAERNGTPPELSQPLIKLKVEHTGFPTTHIPRFGEQFKGKEGPSGWDVANPEDLLTFWRSKSRVPREKGGAGKGQDHDDSEIGGLLEAPEIPDLVDEELTKGMGKEGLKVLFKSDIFDAITRHHPSLPTRACAHNLSCSGPPPRTELSAVLLPDTHIMCDHSFVDKEEKEAIVKMVQKSLKTVKDDFEKKQLHNCPPGELENAVHKDLKERQQQVARPPSHGNMEMRPRYFKL